jgi:hypothetical protein
MRRAYRASSSFPILCRRNKGLMMPPVDSLDMGQTSGPRAGWLIGLAVVTALGSLVTAGVLSGAAIAFAVQAYRRDRGWAAASALGVAAASLGVWIVAWWFWATDDMGAFGEHPARGAGAVFLAAVAVGTVCWVIVESLARRAARVESHSLGSDAMAEPVEFTSWPGTQYSHLERWSDKGKTFCGLEPGRGWTTDDELGNRPICPDCSRVSGSRSEKTDRPGPQRASGIGVEDPHSDD